MLIALSLLLSTAQADLPVHCYSDSTEGTWLFTLNSETYTAGLFKSETRCGHTQPNSAEDIDSSHSLEFETSFSYEVELTAPNIANNDALGEGTWTQ
jgi:hypothetical protein